MMNGKFLVIFVCLISIYTIQSEIFLNAQVHTTPKHTINNVIDKLVGEEVSFTITARDNNGNVIRGWNNTGTDVILSVHNSGANTDNDSLTVTLLKDVSGNPLPKAGLNDFTVSKSLFINGEAQIIFTTTKADTGIYITTFPSNISSNNVSERMNYHADVVQNFLVEIVAAKQPNIVYVMRRYELRVTPRDRFHNINEDESMFVQLTARYPGEFTKSGNIFSGGIFIQGMTNYFLISNTIRTDQSITCYKSSDINVRGSAGPYIVADHAPQKFSLISPPNNTELLIMRSGDVYTFTWHTSVDPYTNILLEGQNKSDTVHYTWVISPMTGSPLSKTSNDAGNDTTLDFTGTQLRNLMIQLAGIPTSRSIEALWHVEATDGLFSTISNEEWKVKISLGTGDLVEKLPSSSTFKLDQNFPNPISSVSRLHTSISFEIPTNEFVTLKIYDVFGNEVSSLVNQNFVSGNHSVIFDAKNLPAGIYFYKLQAGKQKLMRKMLVVN